MIARSRVHTLSRVYSALLPSGASSSFPFFFATDISFTNRPPLDLYTNRRVPCLILDTCLPENYWTYPWLTVSYHSVYNISRARAVRNFFPSCPTFILFSLLFSLTIHIHPYTHLFAYCIDLLNMLVSRNKLAIGILSLTCSWLRQTPHENRRV